MAKIVEGKCGLAVEGHHNTPILRTTAIRPAPPTKKETNLPRVLAITGVVAKARGKAATLFTGAGREAGLDKNEVLPETRRTHRDSAFPPLNRARISTI